MTKRVEPEIPSITLDSDQVKSFKNSQKNTNSANKKSANSKNISDNSNSKANASSPLNTFAMFLIYITVGVSIWWFYQENIKLQNHLINSQQRIALLEDQLSATGEEMGESEVAMKVRLEGLTEKSNKLWGEMDKLWASAWRRNQSEIKELRSKTIKQTNAVTANNKKIDNAITSIRKVEEKQTSTEFNINLLSDQVTAANNTQAEFKKLTEKFATLEEKSSSRDQQQMKVATNVNELDQSFNQLDMSLNLLVERLENLEGRTTKSKAVKPAVSSPTK